MAEANWQKVREVFDAALRQEPAARHEYIKVACGDDEDLRAEVASLFSSFEQSDDFMETPAVSQVADLIESRKTLARGTRFAHYHIILQIGAGGMGEVYLAKDQRLDRRVAIKILNEKYSQDETNLRRFVREAKAASALNHPNILVIHEIGESKGVHFIVSEFIGGRTLREILSQSRMSLGEVLDVAIQIAGALAAAHAASLVHRDIKPENVMVRPDGYVKVVDFGLAKLVEQKRKPLGGRGDAKFIRNQTGRGVILGTANYMSPEQAKGEPLDERTDIFSFGVVLYEMVAGHAPFAGNSTSETLANLITAEPPPPDPNIPPELQRIIAKTLSKNKDERYQSMNDVRTDLEDLKKNLSELEKTTAPSSSGDEVRGAVQMTTANSNRETSATASSFSQQINRQILFAVFALVVLLLGFFVWKMRQDQSKAVQFLKPTQITTWTGLDIYPSFSPDGNSIAYSSDHNGNFEIYIKPLAHGANEIQLTSDGQQNFQPAFSPDGQFIAFYSRNPGGIWIIPATGGKSRQLTTFGSRPAWSPIGNLIAFQSNPIIDLGAGATPAISPSTIWTVSPQGGAPTQLSKTGSPPGGHGSPSWSPNGKRIVFCASDFVEGSVWTISSTGGDLKQAAKGYLVDAVYAPDGESIYYGSNYGLWKVRVPQETGEPVGQPLELANTSPARLRHFAVSADGKKIAYAPLAIISNLQSIPISLASNLPASESVSLTQNRRFRNAFPSFSPDGKKIAYQSFNVGGDSNIWQMNADGSDATQITVAGGFCPSWFPDGEQILFSSNRQERWKGWATNSKTGQDRLLLDFGEDDVQYLRLSPDGRQIAFNSRQSGTINVAIIPTTGGQPRLLTFDKESASFACWSPDGKTLGFQIKRGDDTHVALMPSSGGEITQLTFEKGQSWAFSFSPDGDKIVFAGFRNGVWNLYWVSRTTREQKQLTNYTKLNSYVRYPTWSPSGNQIALEYAETTGNIWIAELK